MAVTGQSGGEEKAREWRWEVDFDAAFLRLSEPVDMLVGVLVALPGLESHRERIYVIVAELFNNALDHGLLALDSGLKASPEGFDDYYRARSDALAGLESGSIGFRFVYRSLDAGGSLWLEVADSGGGFVHDEAGKPLARSSGDYAGMGLNMVRSLCSELRFSAQGNRVEAVYEW